MIRILIADDHDILRAGLKHILQDCQDIVVAGEASDGHEALTLIRQGKWDVLILDMSMPGKSGIEFIKQIKSEFPKLPVLVLSMYKEDMYAVRALKAGASGYLCKDHAETLLAQAIRKVAVGDLYINQAVSEKLAVEMLTGANAGEPHARLTDREYQIFLLVARGQGISEIGRDLNLSVKTVSTHKTRIMEKLNLCSTGALIHYAIRHKLIDEADSFQK
ncbi:MAG: response regulator transcription factor [Betaproteobacteria bacterium]